MLCVWWCLEGSQKVETMLFLFSQTCIAATEPTKGTSLQKNGKTLLKGMFTIHLILSYNKWHRSQKKAQYTKKVNIWSEKGSRCTRCNAVLVRVMCLYPKYTRIFLLLSCMHGNESRPYQLSQYFLFSCNGSSFLLKFLGGWGGMDVKCSFSLLWICMSIISSVADSRLRRLVNLCTNTFNATQKIFSNGVQIYNILHFYSIFIHILVYILLLTHKRQSDPSLTK